MPSINMIAARRAERKRTEKLVYTILLVIVGQVALTLGVMGFMTARVHAANSNIRQLDRQMSKLQPTVERIQRYEGEIQRLKPRLDLLSNSKEQTLLWYAVMHDLARSMPEKTWLSSVSTQVVTDKTTDSSGGTRSSTSTAIGISGVSVSQQLVGETMLRLNQCPEFDKVDLQFTQQRQSGEDTTLQFQIIAKIKPPTSPKGGD